MTTPEPVQDTPQEVTDTSEVVQGTPKTAQEWQALLDERFPEGAAVSGVTANGDLSEISYGCPVLVVMAMRGEWPLIVGIAADGRDVQLLPTSWQEIDRDGHYAARVNQASEAPDIPGEFEVSSWISPEQAAGFAEVRDAQREWLLQVADVPAEEEAPVEGEAPVSEEPASTPVSEPEK